jgi:hypothetical protein
MFLMSLDDTGRTVVHDKSCPMAGCDSLTDKCGDECKRRAAAASLTTTYGTLRGIFNRSGLHRPWDSVSHTGNPCTAPLVDTFLKGSHLEQLKAGCHTKQATLFDTTVYEALLCQVDAVKAFHEEAGSWLDAAKAAQDGLLYSLMWETGLRPTDALHVWWQHLTRLHGPVWSLYIGETKQRKKVTRTRTVDIPVNTDPHGFAVLLERYIAALARIGLDLTHGPLFSTLYWNRTTRTGRFGGRTTYQATSARFKRYVERAGLPGHLALHGFHGSMAARDRARGIPRDVTCARMDWTVSMYNHYLSGRSELSIGVGDATSTLPEEVGE